MLKRSKSDYPSIKNKKLLIISKPIRKDIPKYMKRKKLLFSDPSNFLKLPKEINFNFVVGKKNTIPNVIPYRRLNPSTNFIRMLAKRSTRVQSLSSFSMKLRKAFETSKKIKPINEEDLINLRKKRATEVSNIFSKYRKAINNSENNKKDNNIEFDEEVPNFVKEYINHSLSKQEKALKSQKEYNHIFKKIENNITKTQLRNSKSFNRDLRLIQNNTEHKFYESANLIKNSINVHRNKIEVFKLDENVKKKKNLILENPIRNWEMSLRKPKIFNGIRKGYLNVDSDKRPLWVIATEKYPIDEEKIINPIINDKHNQTVSQLNRIENSNKKIFWKMKKQFLSLKKYNGLVINGKKLIDLEEKQADDLKGNIKILKFYYDKNSIKDLMIKMNYSINKCSSDQKDIVNEIK